jgi:ABC-2 type transport system permease protein
MRNTIKKYIPFFRANIMQMFIYRGTVWLWLLVDVFQFTMMIFLWKSVYQYQDAINGFTFNEMLLYFLLTNVFMIFTEVEAVFAISEEIREGRISLYLIKPISYKRRLFFELLGRVIGLLILLLPIVTIFGTILTFIFDIVWTVSLVEVLMAIIFVPLIFTLMFEFSFLFGMIAIYTTNVFGVVIFLSVLVRIFSGQLVPLALYPDFLVNVIKYMPFQYISYPPLLILNKLDMTPALHGILILVLWIIGLKILNHIVFKFSMKKMVVFGG